MRNPTPWSFLPRGYSPSHAYRTSNDAAVTSTRMAEVSSLYADAPSNVAPGAVQAQLPANHPFQNVPDESGNALVWTATEPSSVFVESPAAIRKFFAFDVSARIPLQPNDPAPSPAVRADANLIAVALCVRAPSD